MSPRRQLRSHTCTQADTLTGRVYPRRVSARLKDWPSRMEGWQWRGRETWKKAGDLEKSEVEGGAAVCDERLGEGREEEERLAVPPYFFPSLWIAAGTWRWELIKLFLHVGRLMVMLNSSVKRGKSTECATLSECCIRGHELQQIESHRMWGAWCNGLTDCI